MSTIIDEPPGEPDQQGQLSAQHRETHQRMVARFLAAKVTAQVRAGTANTTAWTVQQHDQAKGVYVDRLTTDNVVEAHEMFQRGPDFRVLDNSLNDFAADYENGNPIYHGRSQFHTELQRKLQANVDVLPALATALLRASQAVDVSVLNDTRRARTCRYVVDGGVYQDDSDGPLYQADGQHPPFVVFDVEHQETLPGRYDTRGAAEAALVAHVVQEAVNTLAAAALTIAERPAAPINLRASDGAAQILGDIPDSDAGPSAEATSLQREELAAEKKLIDAVAMPGITQGPSGAEVPPVPGHIGIRLEGGVIQSIFSDRPMDVTVIDYDTEDRDAEDRLFDMPQKDGRTSQCVIHEYPAVVMPEECRRIRDALAADASDDVAEEPEGMRP